MDPKLRASFIPRQSVAPGSHNEQPRKGKPMNLITLLTFLLFLASLASAGGVFGYTFYLEQTIENKSQELESIRNETQRDEIATIRRLDQHLRAATDIVGEHLAFSAFFDHLGSTTLQNIQFISFDYLQHDDGGLEITLGGKAPDYVSVALQSEQFENSPIILSPLFSDLNLDDEGNIGFTVTALLARSDVLYANAFTALPSGEGESVVPGDSATTSDLLEDSAATTTATSTTP